MTKSEMAKLAVDKKLLGGVALRKLMKSKTKTETKTPVKKKLAVDKKLLGGVALKKLLKSKAKTKTPVKKKLGGGRVRRRIM